MEPSPTRPRVLLGLADEPGQPLIAAPWIGSFIALGSLLRRFLPRVSGRQLVLAVSVPRRDYVAALIGTGWMLSCSAPSLNSPASVFAESNQSTYLRGVTDNLIISGRFTKVEAHRDGARVLLGGRLLPIDRYRAVHVLEGQQESVCSPVPNGGYLAEMAGISTSWLDRLAAPPMDLALVGTSKWLREDLATVVGDGTSGGFSAAPLSNYVLPFDSRGATWATPTISAARLAEGVALPETCSAVVLDRYGAIKYLNDITVPIVVCIVDRSVVDDSAAETIIEARHNNSRPVSVAEELRWLPPAAVEVLAFTVAV